MKVGITIDGVIRDFITKFESVYDKYYPAELDDDEEELEELPERDIKSLNLLDYFEFTGGTKALNEFMYVESSLEIFGHAGETKLNSVEHLNQLHNLLAIQPNLVVSFVLEPLRFCQHYYYVFQPSIFVTVLHVQTSVGSSQPLILRTPP